MRTATKRSLATTALLTAGLLALSACSGTAEKPSGGSDEKAAKTTAVSIVVPADPGGGWDQTGRAISKTLLDEKIVASAPVTNVGGAGGTVGLAQLANEKNPDTLMMTGLAMVGAVETNKAAVRIEDTTPIARLTDEPLVVVVPAASPYKKLDDLVKDIVKKGQDITITGGSAGGADHILAGLLLEAAGLKGADIAAKLNYIPNSGGGEATSLIIGNQVSAGISGVGEFVQHIESGDMRALAVSSAKPVAQLKDTPTITDAGYDVVLTNWRGVIAPGGIDKAKKAELERIVTDLHENKAWTAVLEERGWNDAFLVGKDFDTFVKGNITDVSATLKNIGLVG